jgi:hypothetical protein
VWIAPFLALVGAAIVASAWSRGRVRVAFAVTAVFLTAAGLLPRPMPFEIWLREAFLTPLLPMALLAIGLTAAVLAVARGPSHGRDWGVRHWGGIAACLLPGLWFLSCCNVGLADVGTQLWWLMG